MAKIKYRVKEFTPSDKMSGTHSVYADVVISTDITSVELAKKVAARTGMRSYEVAAAINAIADVIAEETLEGSRVSLTSEDGARFVTIYPKVSGSISDAEVQANPQKYNNAKKATEDMLTPDRLQWTLGASVGPKYVKQFVLNKVAQKVKVTATDVVADDSPSEGEGTRTPGGKDSGGSSQSGSGSTQEGGQGND